MTRWGSFVARRPVVVLLATLALTILAGAYGSGVFGSLSNGGFEDADTDSAKELVVERELFGNQSADVIAIYSSEQMTADDPAFSNEVARVVADLPKSQVASAVSWYDTHDPSMRSDDGHAVQVVISLKGDTQDEKSDLYADLEQHLEAGGSLDTQIAGTWAVYTDLNEVVSEDLARAELISMPLVLLLSLLIFGSLVAASMPVMVGLVAVMGSLAAIRVLAEITEVSVFSVNVITLLGIGLAIDYALFVISRFREELAPGGPEGEGADVSQALVTTMASAGRTVLFSGLTVAVSMSSLLVFPQAFLRSIGYGGIAAVLVAMIAALTILPAVLRLLGHRIDAGRVPFLGRRRAHETDGGAWARIAHAVMRRPVIYAVGITAALLVIASPFLDVKWGSVDYRVLPTDAASHQASARLADDFGAERSSAEIVVRGADQDQTAAYADDLRAVDGVVDVREVDRAGEDSLIRVVWEGNSQSQRSQELVHDLRDVAAPDGSEALVGGMTADTVDLIESIGNHLPWMVLVVVLSMMVLLFFAFGSVVLPIKAVVMNAISISASFGVVTWIFSDGHLEGLLDYTSSGFLDVTQPILMLAILFGLSMDYEVFLLSRVREEWDRTGDNEAAVAAGVQKTGRIITGAALLLAVVIGAFGLSGVVFMKMIGIGMLVALLVDATIIRALLVPATMKLLGRANWWAPAPLARWWSRSGLRH